MTVRGDASTVVVFNLGQARPIFHLPEEWASRPGVVLLDDGWRRNEHRTRCGVLKWAIEWRDVVGLRSSETREHVDRGTYLRRDHAEKIGRLCDRCKAAT